VVAVARHGGWRRQNRLAIQLDLSLIPARMKYFVEHSHGRTVAARGLALVTQIDPAEVLSNEHEHATDDHEADDDPRLHAASLGCCTGH
jgi:hypothetical protein